MVGKTFSHYKIYEKLGQGGMGVVYKALDTSLNRFVALKFLPQHLTEDESIRQRFMVEAQAASALDHPNICTIHEINETPDGQLYICMAYYEGESLREKIDHGQISFEEALNIFFQIAQGLKATHENNIIHRDIKPGNILITQNGDVKIADFGLAKLAGVDLTKSTISKGTAAYMCPEQIRGQKVDFRCDIWALGIILYEMMSGCLPFEGEYPEPMMYAIVNEEPTPLSHYLKNSPESLQAIIDKMLKKDQTERYQSVLEVLHDVEPLLNKHSAIVKKSTSAIPVRRKKKKAHPYILFAATVVVIFFLIFEFISFHKSKIYSIAVLPFENFSNDAGQEHYADGMTDALITELEKISALRVISRTSVMHYKKNPKPLSDIAEELYVDIVVEGSIQRNEDNIHITTKLRQAMPEKLLWSGEDERHIRDVLTLQKDVVRAIVDEMRINLTPEEEANLARKKTVDPEAYELYLKGNYYVLNHPTVQASQVGIEYYLKAIEKDSSFAQVYAALADAYTSFGSMGIAPPKDVLPIAKKYAQKAFELDESLAEVHAALGYIKMHEWDWTGAEESMERAILLNPGWSFGYANHSWIMAVQRRYDESIASAIKVHDLNPLSPGTMIGERLYEAGRYDEAIEQLKRAINSDPISAYAHWFLGFSYEKKKMYVEAIHHHKKAVDYSGGMASNIASLGHAYAISGQKDKAYDVLNELMELSKEKYISSYDIAIVYAGLREIDEAMSWLEKAVEQRDGYLGGFINVDRRWDFLRSNQRFAKVLKTIGF